MDKGKLVKGTGAVLGTVLEYNLVLAGLAIGGVVMLAGNKNVGRNIKKAGKQLGKLTGMAAKTSANILGTVIQAASSEGVQLGKAVGKKVVQSRIRIYGDPKEFFDKDKIVEATYEQTK